MPRKAKALVDLANVEFGEENLTSAEASFFLHVENGEPVDYSREDDEIPPVHDTGWGENRTIDASRIIWIYEDEEAKKFIKRNGVVISGARITNDLDLSLIETRFPLRLIGCDIREPIDLSGAKMHTLEISKSCINGICADGAEVSGDVFLNNELISNGEIRLLGAAIGGDFDCRGSKITGESNIALYADGLNTGGSVYLSDDFEANGEVILLGVRIGGDLDCSSGSFTKGAVDALSLHRASIEGDVQFEDQFKAIGKVVLSGTTIGGALRIKDVRAPEAYTLNLNDAKVGTVFRDEKSSWPASITIDGFTYKRIDPASAELRKQWLDRRLADDRSLQPFAQLAAVLSEMGHLDWAREIRIAKEKEMAAQIPLRFGSARNPRFWWCHVWGPLIGFGYQTWKALPLVAAFLFVGFLAFGFGHQGELVTPISGSPIAKYTESPPHTEPREVPLFNSEVALLYPKYNWFIYPLDLFVPIIDFGQAKYWMPNPHRGKTIVELHGHRLTEGGLLRAYYWIHIVAGWVLSTLLVIGFSGIVRE